MGSRVNNGELVDVIMCVFEMLCHDIDPQDNIMDKWRHRQGNGDSGLKEGLCKRVIVNIEHGDYIHHYAQRGGCRAPQLYAILASQG